MGCFTNVSRALHNYLAKIYNTRNHIYVENFKLKLCTCAQSYAFGTCTKFQLELLIRSTISAIHKFRQNILESLQNVSETSPWCSYQHFWKFDQPHHSKCSIEVVNIKIYIVNHCEILFFNYTIDNIFIQENAFENVVCKMATILFEYQCVNSPPYS